MKAITQLNNTWIEDAWVDVESSVSSVVTVETTDPRRLQLLNHTLVENFQENVYCFEPWQGLQKASINTNGSGYRLAPFNPGQGADMMK